MENRRSKLDRRLCRIPKTKVVAICDVFEARVALSPRWHDWLDDKALAELQKKFARPMWHKVGDLAKQIGGHGGMDFIMEYRLCPCLLNGLPLDHSVYDGITWSLLVELTEQSVRQDGSSVAIPDFTRGGWKTAEPLGFVEV